MVFFFLNQSCYKVYFHIDLKAYLICMQSSLSFIYVSSVFSQLLVIGSCPNSMPCTELCSQAEATSLDPVSTLHHLFLL